MLTVYQQIMLGTSVFMQILNFVGGGTFSLYICYPLGNWEVLPIYIWKRSFHLNMTASGYCDFTEARQKAIVLHCLGQESQRLLFSTISDETYTTISKVNVEKDIKELFVKINVAGEKSTFRARHQKHSEPVESYVASLRELASTCEFGAFEEEAIRLFIIMRSVNLVLELIYRKQRFT